MNQFLKQLPALVAVAMLLAGCSGNEKAQDGKTEAQKTTAATSSGGDSQGAPDPQRAQSAAGFDSPEEAFQAFKTAAIDEDYQAAVACLDAESQNAMAELITLPLAMIAAFDPDKKEDIEGLLSKHNVSTETEEFPIEAIPDKVAYIVDVMKWLDENADEQPGGGPLARISEGTLGEVTTEGDAASATVEIASGGSEDMDFRRVDGRWYLHLPVEEGFSAESTISPDGSGFGADTFDSFPSFGEDEPEAPVEAVSLDEYNAAWQVTMNASDQPAGELLTSLAQELGLQLNTDALDGSILETPVSVDVSGGSRFEVIESICSQIEATPAYSGENLQIMPGQRSLPVKFAGPFVIEVKRLETQTDTATGTIEIQTYTAGLSAPVMQQLNKSSGAASIEDIQNPDGDSVKRELGSGGFFMGTSSSIFDRTLASGLKNLLRDVTTIDIVQGQVDLTLPIKVEVLEFEELTPDVKKSAGDVTLTLTEINGNEFAFEFTNAKAEAIQILAFDKDEERVESIASSHFTSDDSGMLTEVYENAPEKIDARVISEMEPLEYEFAFEKIPVPNNAEMPEQLAELTFEGDQPMALEFVKIDRGDGFPHAVFRVKNQANKDAAQISIRMVYLDADGKELDDNASSYNEEPIPAGEEVEVSLTAFFMPDETQSVRGELTDAEFTDATRWETGENLEAEEVEEVDSEQ